MAGDGQRRLVQLRDFSVYQRLQSLFKAVIVSLQFSLILLLIWPN